MTKRPSNIIKAEFTPIEFEESTRDIILNNTVKGKTYCSMSFKNIISIGRRQLFSVLKNLSDEGYFEDIGLKKIPKINQPVRVYKRN